MARMRLADRPIRPWYQFSLRNLLCFVAATAAFFAMIRWFQELGIAACLLAAGALFIGNGIYRQRTSRTVVGIALIVSLAAVSPWLLVAVCWVGSETMAVPVRVQDVRGVPITGAVVTLSSKYTLFPSAAVTSSTGAAVVTGQFQTCGTDRFLHRSAMVEILGERVVVVANGFEPFDRGLDELVPRGWHAIGESPPEILIHLRADPARP